MPSYNFKKEAEVFVVYNASKYKLDVSSITFSQTFTEQSYSVKTLHNQKNLFDSSVINKANPANFEITLPLLKEADFTTVFDLLVKYASTTSTLSGSDGHHGGGSNYINAQKGLARSHDNKSK